MKRLLILIVMLVASLSLTLAQSLENRLRNHVEYLTSDALAGRKAGSEGGKAAAEYIEQTFDSKLGLNTRTHYFTEVLEDGNFCNIIGGIEGIQPNKYIVVGAHYDHLGTKRGKIYHGADDNASGTAALLEVARLMTERNYRPQHTILFVAFDAEEMGLYGSEAFVEKHGLSDQNVKVMINMDMVGWLKDGELNIEGTGTLEGSDGMLDRLASKHNITLHTKSFETSRLTGTDTEAFAQAGIPTLSLNTGFDSPYHQPEDTADKIDYQGLAKITKFVSDLIVEVDGDKAIASSGKVARKHRSEKTFEVALTYGGGKNRFDYPGAAVNGREARSWNLGLTGQYSFRHIALRTSALYNRRKAVVPSDWSNMYSSASTLMFQSVTVPAEVILKTGGNNLSFYIGAGGFYVWNFGTRLDGVQVAINQPGINEHEYGWQWSFGCRVADFYFEQTNRRGLSAVYTDTEVITDMPKVLNFTSHFTFGIFF